MIPGPLHHDQDISSNVFYLNEGLKSDYHGHGKLYHDNINIGAGGPRV